MAFVRQTHFLLVVTAFAGVAWTSTATNSGWPGTREPGGLAANDATVPHMFFFTGSDALAASSTEQPHRYSASRSIVAVAVLIPVWLLTFRCYLSPLSIDFTHRLSFEPGAVTPMSREFVHVPQPRMGPVLMTIDFHWTKLVDASSTVHERGFADSLAHGATAGSYFADPPPNHFHAEIMMPSGLNTCFTSSVLRSRKRGDRSAISLHIGEDPPEIRMYIRVNKTFREERVKKLSRLITSLRSAFQLFASGQGFLLALKRSFIHIRSPFCTWKANA